MNTLQTTKKERFLTLCCKIASENPDDLRITEATTFYKLLVNRFGMEAVPEFLGAIAGLFPEEGESIRRLKAIPPLPNSAKEVIREMIQPNINKMNRRQALAVFLAVAGLVGSSYTLNESNKHISALEKEQASPTPLPSTIKTHTDAALLYGGLTFLGALAILWGSYDSVSQCIRDRFNERLLDTSPDMEYRLHHILRGTGKFIHAYFDLIEERQPVATRLR